MELDKNLLHNAVRDLRLEPAKYTSALFEQLAVANTEQLHLPKCAGAENCILRNIDTDIILPPPPNQIQRTPF